MSVILITGSSTGIGFATAETLARSGHKVCATMRNPQRSPQLQQLADKENLPLTILPMDVLQDDSVENAFEFVLSKEGCIDVLVNNAGIHSWGAVEELPMASFQKEMDTNYFGALRCIKAVVPSMREKQSGMIINISSIAGEVFSNFHGTYAPSKAALEALSESLAQELKPFGIKIFVVQPGITETELFDKTTPIHSNTFYPNIKRFLAMFAASLEYHVPPETVAEVINDIVEGKKTTFRNSAGPFAEGFLGYRSSLSDDDWCNSVSVDDDAWINGMEQMGLSVRKYMRADDLPKFGREQGVEIG